MANPTLDVSGDYTVFDNVETVTYYVRSGSSYASPATTVTGALPEMVMYETIPGPGGANVQSQSLTWHLWVALLGGISPKYGDVIQRTSGDRYTVIDASLETLASRYKCNTIKER